MTKIPMVINEQEEEKVDTSEDAGSSSQVSIPWNKPNNIQYLHPQAWDDRWEYD
jgi:hypothetical protein